MTQLTTYQKIGLVLNAIFYMGAGAMHFLRPAPYLKIMPSYLPWHSELVAVSGLLEILGGVGLLYPPTRRAAAWGLVALLVAVFPANVFMAMSPVEAGAGALPAFVRWGRLPLQPLLVWWVLSCTRPGAAR